MLFSNEYLVTVSPTGPFVAVMHGVEFFRALQEAPKRGLSDAVAWLPRSIPTPIAVSGNASIGVLLWTSLGTGAP